MSIYAYSPKKSSIQCLHYIIIILICQFFLLRTLTILRRFDIILNVTRLNILNFRAINSVGRVLPSHGRSREFESLIAHHKKRHAARRVFFYGGRLTDEYAATYCRRSSICRKANSANDYKQKVFEIYAAICFVVRQFAAKPKNIFFTKEHNSSAFLWIIRLTFPKSYYIIET